MNRFGCFREPKKIVCAECGKEFIAFRHAVACSPECARVRKNRMSRDYRQNRAKPEPKREYLRRAKREEWPGVPVKYNIRRRWAEFVHGEGCDWKALTPLAANVPRKEGK